MANEVRTQRNVVVELSPVAWAEVGRLSAPEFSALQQALNELSTRMRSQLTDIDSVEKVAFGDAEAWFVFDAATSRLTVLDIYRADSR